MEGATYRVLFEGVVRTLHSQNFARSSTEACNVFTDLLIRYLKLLALTCAKHAHHCGRTDLTALDTVRSLEELGAALSELKSFQEVEGKDLARYAYCSQRRQMDLREIKTYLYEGLVEEHDDLQHIVYRQYESDDEGGDEDGEGEFEDEDLMDIDTTEAVMDSLAQPTNHAPPPVINITRSPPLPPSPISNPSSPTPRRRARFNNWEPPDHIPDFLPPFPVIAPEPGLTETPVDQVAETPAPTPQPERELSPTPPPSAPTGRASYLSSVPYESSSISGKSTNHLPKTPAKTKPKTSVSSRVHLALLNAQHHLLTNPPPPPSTQLPSRHNLALALLQSSRNRYQPPDSAFGISEPNRIRFGAPTPSFPIALKSEDKSGTPLPQTSKSMIPGDPILPLVSLQPSRLPSLARNVLSAPIYRKITRTLPPPALQRDNRKLTYGPGIPAPWNSKASDDKLNANKSKEREREKNGVDGGVKLVDALMYATWDWDAKDFRTPLGPRRGKIPTLGKTKDKDRDRERLGELREP